MSDPPAPASAEDDAAVQGTNDDATASKLACVQLGYWDDQFVQHFVRRPLRRPPLINRGYFARVAAIRQLLTQFLAAGEGRKQVLSLGAGFDTTAFTLAATGCAPDLYCEVDFAETAARKAASIARVPALRDALGGAACVQDGPASVTAPRYALRPADVRQPAALAAVLEAAGVDWAAPTFILLECVLVYLEPSEGASLLAWAAAAFPTAAVLVYDPTRPDDPFGTQMRLNLAARGCPLRGVAGGATPAAHAARLRAAGWQRGEAADMLEVYERVVPPALRARAERCEWLDEVEEWVLIQRHYALALGVNDAAGRLQGLALGCGE